MDLNLITLITSMVAIFAVAITVMMYLYKKQKIEAEKRHYDFNEMRAELEMMRNKLEKDIYQLNDRLVSTEERWKDVNHLILSSQSKSPDVDSPSKNPQFSSFLKNAGIQEEELQIDKNLIFVLTPFHDNMDSSFEAIKEACTEVGFKCLRGDEEYIEGDILSHILKSMVKARIVIANITGRNSNVFYELGIAHAIDKPTIIVSKSLEGVPFDIQSRRMLLYENEQELKNKTKENLAKILAKE